MRNRSSYLFGIILVVFGFLFLLNSLGIIAFGKSFSIVWPLTVIIVGIWLMMRTRRDYLTRNDRYFFRIFGDVQYGAQGKVPASMTVTTVFGDVRLDLSRAEFDQPVHTFDCSIVFGDVKVIVPPNVAVSASGHSLFGEIHFMGKTASGMANSLDFLGGSTEPQAKKLVVSGATLFGDIEVLSSV